MKIQFIHNYYQQVGGEDNVVANEIDLFKSNGHDVALYSLHNDQITGLSKKISTMLNLNGSPRQKTELINYLSKSKPDIVHVHNFFPLITPVVFDVCNELGIPSVLTLHNYRLICPGAMLMRNERPCELCIQGSPYNAVRYKCYRNSMLGSAAVARMVDRQRKEKTWESKVSRFIALTEFARSRFVNAGFPEKRLIVKPNFVESRGLLESTGLRQGALFVGRVSGEKGVADLVKAWDGLDIPLTIAGDGPLLESLPRNDNIRYLGKVPHDQVVDLMRSSDLLIVPSVWYEGFPMVIAEAYANGLPVAASNIGSLSEVVKDSYTGYHFKPRDPVDLARVIQSAFSNREKLKELSSNARREYETFYTPEKNLQQMLSIYHSIIKS